MNKIFIAIFRSLLQCFLWHKYGNLIGMWKDGSVWVQGPIVLFHIVLQLHILLQFKYIVLSGKQFQT